MASKIGAYLRVSTDSQDVKSQRHAVKTWAKANHIPISEIKFFVDKGKTGANTDREQLKKLLWSVEKGRLDTICLYSLSRLARNTQDGLRILSDLADKGIRIVSISENIDFNSTTGKLVASILLSVATWERSTIVERIKAGMAASKKAGKHVGRPADLKRLQMIRKMKDEGATVIQIADKLECSRQNVYSALKKTA